MSTVWRGSEVLWREPWGSVIGRTLRRGVIGALALLLSGMPGTSWTGISPYAWLRIPFLIIGLLWGLLFVLAFANVARSRRIVLMIMGTGSVERPRSIQEVWLRRPREVVMGRTITVTPPTATYRITRAEPYVVLSGDGAIKGVPLFRTDPAAFVEQVNAISRGRGVTFVLAKPAADPEPSAST
jgi:hypothetical protein